MIKLINLLDIFINIFILVIIHIIFCKIERNNSNKKGLICLKYLARILHYPLILYFSIYIISHKDNMLILYLGTDILYYIIKIKMFSKTFCVLLALLNLIQIIYEIIICNGNDVKKNDKIYAIGTIIMILKIFLIIILIIIALTIFDIKPTSLLLTIGTPLTLLSLLLKATIEDILFGIYLRISQIYKTGDRILLLERNIEGYINNFGLRMIEIKTLDNNILYLRNFTFLNNLVINKSNISSHNTGFSIEIRSSDVNNIDCIIKNIKEWGNKNKYSSENLIITLKGIKYDIFKIDIFIGNKNKDVNAENSIELEFIKILKEVIEKNNCSLENLQNITKQ